MNAHEKQRYIDGVNAVIDGIVYAVHGAEDPMAEVTDALIFYVADRIDCRLSFLDIDFIRHLLRQRLMADPFADLPRFGA